MDPSETLCLRWNEFESNIKQGFSQLRSNEDFFDVTLSTDGSNSIRAHRVILSACSSFFRSLLKSIPSQTYPLLYLRGIQSKHLESILSFMYNGEVRVHPQELDEFLGIAQELRVNGLMAEVGKGEEDPEVQEVPVVDNTKTNQENQLKIEESLSPSPSKRMHLQEPTTSTKQKDEESNYNSASVNNDIIISEVKVEHSSGSSKGIYVNPNNSGELKDDGSANNSYSNNEFINDFEINEAESETLTDVDKVNGISENELLDAELMKYVSPRGSNHMHKCLKCSYSSPRLMNVKRHVEAKHFLTDGFKCQKCSRVFKTRDSRSKHYVKQHKGEPVVYSTAHFT